MPFKSSKSFELGKFVETQVTRKTVLGQGVGGAGGSISNIPKLTATGGTETVIQASNGRYYKTHVYTTTGPNPFNVTETSPTSGINAELIGAGGQGAPTWDGCRGGPSGGSGGFGIFVDYPVSDAGNYTVTVGAQPGGPTTMSRPFMPGTFTITAGGGGAGPTTINAPPAGAGGVSISAEAIGKAKLFGGTLGNQASSFTAYNPFIFLHPTPLQPLNTGLFGPPRFCTPGPPAPGNGTPGGARIYYEVPAP
jgi:hypothetical protein